MLLGILLHRTDGLGRGLALAHGADGAWLAASVVLYLASTALRALRWRILLPRAESFRTLYGITGVHTMVNGLLPARLGELAFPILMRSHAATAAPRSLTMFVVARALDVAALGLLFLAGSLAHLGADSAGWGLALTAAGVVVGVGVLAQAGPLLSWTLRRGERWFPGRGRLLELGKGVQADLLEMTSSRTLLRLAVVTLAMVLARHVYFWATLRAVGLPLGLPAVVVGATLGEATYLLPVHGIAGLGTVEAGWALGMTLVGLPFADAVASGLFVHLWSLGLSTATGCFSLPLLRTSTVYSPPSGG